MKTTFLPDSDTIPDEIQHAVMIHSTRKNCFQVLTSAEGWNAWFTTTMSLDAQPGGTIIFEWKNWGADNLSTGDFGQVLEMVTDRKFSYSWHPDSSDYSTRVQLVLEDHPDGCVVRLRENGFANTPEGMHAMLQSAAGWGEALTLLKMFVENGIVCKGKSDH